MSIIILNRDGWVRLICSTWTATLGENLWAALLGETSSCSKTYKATELEIWPKWTTDSHKMESLHTRVNALYICVCPCRSVSCLPRLRWKFWDRRVKPVCHNSAWGWYLLTCSQQICTLQTLSNAYLQLRRAKGVGRPWHRQKWKPYLISAL